MAKTIYGYWNIRGLAEPGRYLLHYRNVDFEDKRYDLDHMDSWHKDKFNLGLDFPNLPYLIDDEYNVKLTQSVAILRYLAKKYRLDGNSIEDKIQLSVVEQELIDLRTNIANLCYSEDFEKLKPAFIVSASAKLKHLAEYLGDKAFLAGEYVTYVDFMAYNEIDFHRYVIPDFMAKNPVLKKYLDRIKNLPGLKEYIQSPAYREWPLYSSGAKFGGSGSPPDC